MSKYRYYYYFLYTEYKIKSTLIIPALLALALIGWVILGITEQLTKKQTGVSAKIAYVFLGGIGVFVALYALILMSKA